MEERCQDRIYSETLPWTTLVQPETLALVARYDLELVLAVRPWDLEMLPDTARAIADAGISLSVWPMLEDTHGRWINVQNAHEFRTFVLKILETLEPALPRDLMFDLEPPFESARALRFGRLWTTPDGFDDAARAVAQMGNEVRARGIATSAAVWPMVALDREHEWQSLLGTPTDALDASHVSVMLYTTIFEGWSRGLVRRRDARALLAAAAKRTAERWGANAGVSLGCVGIGAFEDEPTYRDATELAQDVAIARAAGVQRLSLFDLGGVLSRGPEEWLDAFKYGGDANFEPSRRVRIARFVARVATSVLATRR
jgi:hypothetical protein